MGRFFLAVFLAGFLTGCGGTGVLSEMPLDGQDAPYLLDSGDQLRIIVFGQEDLSGQYAVDGAGHISMPLLPPIIARGATTDQLESALVSALSQSLLRNPNVSVEVVTFRPFFILGEVVRSGQYPFVAGMTVQTAVAIAGGYTHRADEDVVRITRNMGDRIVELGVPTTSAIRPGDTILVGERYF